jgi:glutaconate CoA-transferase subunit B
VIGDYEHPKTRFSGSGGGCDVASFVPKSLIFMQQERRKFVNELDYLTSPGFLDGPDGRSNAGLPQGGPMMVITNMGTMRFDDTTKEMYLSGFYPGITPEQILEKMEFPVDITRAREEIPPTPDELRLLRDECDPQGLIL